jgi:hypothetical protein
MNDGGSITIVLGLIIVVVVVAWLIRGRSRVVHPDILRRVLHANGAGRCVAALRLFQDLAARRDEASIAIAWEALELPLLQALPDCPPDAKAALVLALDACAMACGNRDLDKRIMTLRDGLYPSESRET